MKFHVVLNSHLDPVWLWNRSQGIDAVLATAATACNLLDEYPEIHITRGESWFYETVERLAPDTFRRIGKFIADGRWHVVGNWYTQSDCNLPPAELIHRQTEWSAKYFADRFGITVKTGYNVDSFGHAITLPDLYRAHGIENYVMMRPGVQEMTLPSNLFHWQSPSGNRLLTYRISYSYCTDPSCRVVSMTNQIEAILKESDPAVGAAMFFVGVGDHGGGPIRNELTILEQMREKYPEHQFVFSHPDRFFDEIRSANPELPLVTDELQHHAIGCYSAVSAIKNGLYKSTSLLCAAEKAVSRLENPLPEWKTRLENAWKTVFFNAFHDVLAGTCIAPACSETLDELASSAAEARHIIEDAIRIPNAELPPAPLQRIIADNLGEDFDDYISFTPWIGPWIHLEHFSGWAQLKKGYGLLQDEAGNAIPSCDINPLGAANTTPQSIIRLKLKAGERKILTMDPGKPMADAGGAPDAAGKCLPIFNGGEVSFGRNGVPWTSPISIQVAKDDSDTWSHAINSFDGEVEYSFAPSPEWKERFNVSLFKRDYNTFRGEDGFARMDITSYHGIPAAEISLKLHWFGSCKIVKLRLKPTFEIVSRKDGIMGGAFNRRLNGEEYPFRSWTMLSASDGRSVALVAKGVSSLDVQPDGTLGITLLRSPYYAHHCPFVPPEGHDFPVTDQGEHEYTFRILLLDTPDEEQVEKHAAVLNRQIFFSESTHGVKAPKN